MFISAVKLGILTVFISETHFWSQDQVATNAGSFHFSALEVARWEKNINALCFCACLNIAS